jgi:mono/diheme cytochrome c family protein
MRNLLSIAFLVGTGLALRAAPVLAADDAGTGLDFSNHGVATKTVSAAGLKALSAPRDVTVYEPHREAQTSYRGIPLVPMLDSVYGPAWRKSEMVFFRCTDGYLAAVPVEKILRHPADLAFAFPDGAPFTMTNHKQNEEKVTLGPWYLVWEDSPFIRGEGGADWPYQVVGIDLNDFAVKFPRMAPAAKAGAAVTRGFLAFRRNCSTCHTINGEGGGKAVELNYPANVTEYYRAEWIRKWIDKPTSVRFNTTMPALDSDVPDRAAVIEDLLAYLASMKNRKVEPPAATAEKP